MFVCWALVFVYSVFMFTRPWVFKKHVYKQTDCEDCKLECHDEILTKDVELPNRTINKCLPFQNFPDVSDDKSNNHIFIRQKQDTVYDFSDHNICNLGSEKVWNNFTKRNMNNNIDCNE